MKGRGFGMKSWMPLFALGLAAAGCGAPGLEESLDDARASIAAGDFATASIHLRNALQADGTSVDARMVAADLAWRAGDIPSALAQLEWVQDSGAASAVYATPLARVLVETGEPQRALDLLDAGDAAGSGDSAIALIRSDALLVLGEYDASADALTEAQARGAPVDQVALRRARAAYAQGALDDARSELERALAANPDFPEALAFRALLVANSGDLAAAETDFENAVELYNGSGQALRASPLLLALVELELAAGDIAKAENAATRLAATVPGSPASDYATALVAFRAGRFADAVTSLRSLVTNVPDDPRFQLLLGASQLGVGNVGQAEQEFQSLLSRNPADSVALRLLVESRLQQQRFAAAVDAFDTYGAAYDETDLGLAALRARSLLESGDNAQAIESLGRALEQSPGNQAFVLMLVEAQLRAGDPDAAAETLRSIPELGGDEEIVASVQSLIAAMRQGGPEAGAPFVAELIAQGPDDAVAHVTAAFHEQMRGEFDDALVSLDTALRLDPNLVAGHIMRGALLQRVGDSAAAKAAFDAAIALAPDNSTALAARALIAVTEQDYGRGGELFERAFAASGDFSFLANQTIALRLAADPAWATTLSTWLEARPQELGGWLFLATQQRLAGNLAGAVSAYERVLAVDANHLEALNNAAWLAGELDRDEALAYARRAEALAPDNGAVLDTLGWVLVRRSMVAEGLPYLERANQLLPDTAEIQYHLGVAQLESGNGAAARITLDRALTGALPPDLRREAERLIASL